MDTNVGLPVFCKAKEDAFDRLSVELVPFLIRYVDVHPAPEYSQVHDSQFVSSKCFMWHQILVDCASGDMI